ncbi:hypothetical protein WL91_27980 [Burkholderia multivorans]|nr:hypothetical protein WL91_27980 [Burkholderia multivorans]
MRLAHGDSVSGKEEQEDRCIAAPRASLARRASRMRRRAQPGATATGGRLEGERLQRSGSRGGP